MKIITKILLLLFCSTLSVFAQSPFKLLRAELFAGPSKGDYSVYDISSNMVYGGSLSAGIHLWQYINSQADLLIGKFSGKERIIIGAYRIYYRTDNYLAGISYQHTDIESIKSDMISLNGEVYKGNLLSVTGSSGYEFKNFGEDLIFAELFLNIYLKSNLMFSSGVSYAVAEIKQTRADIILKAEYIPVSFNNFSPVLFLEYGGNYLTKLAAGFKFYFGEKKSLKQQHDTRGFYSARFR